MNVKPPFFSIIIATYNRGDLLKHALTSLLNQTEKDWEVLIIDDGSTDDTPQIVARFNEKITSLRYYKQKNKGVIAAKNKGVCKARGRYIAFLDSDDTYLPRHLSLRKEKLLKNPSIEFLFGGVKIIGDPYVPDCTQPGELIHLSKCAVSGSFCIKREKILALKGFDGTPLSTDADFLRRAEEAAIKMEKVDYATYVYHRDGRDSVTQSAAKELRKK